MAQQTLFFSKSLFFKKLLILSKIDLPLVKLKIKFLR